MWKSPRIWLLLIALIAVALAVYFEPTYCVRGWLHGEAFFEGRPTSYSAREIQQWERGVSVGGLHWARVSYVRRSSWPTVLKPFLKEPAHEWPRLLNGDSNGFAVLQQLRFYPDSDVQDWARVGLERINNDDRGAGKTVALTQLDESLWRPVP